MASKTEPESRATISEITSAVCSIKELATCIPETPEELRARIKTYFQTCESLSLRPGIESLSLAIGTDRRRLHEWLSGSGRGKNEEYRRVLESAKQTIIATIEGGALSGKLNPAVYCFFMKNVAHYSDNPNEAPTKPNETKMISASDLPTLCAPVIVSENREDTDDLPF